MNILLTAHRISGRAGVQSVVRDLAYALQQRGHTLMIFASGSTSQRLLENDLVPVVPDLRKLKLKPDIIHAQNHMEAMIALATLPGTPALYHAHDATCSTSHR